MKTISTAASKKALTVFNARTLAMTAMLATISFILGFLEFPVPLSPSFSRMELSDFPALIGAFAFGPGPVVAIEFVKNALQFVVNLYRRDWGTGKLCYGRFLCVYCRDYL